MRYAEFVKKSPEYALLKAESQTHASGYLIVGKDGIFTDVLCKLFLSDITNLPLERIENGVADITIYDEKILTNIAEDIISKAYFTPVELQKKIFVIKCDKQINDSAQNKLLKILEEPPQSTAFIFTAKEESHLLATVRSRLKIIRCRPFADEEMSKLCDAYFENSLFAQSLCAGSIERAEKFASAEYFELYRSILTMLFNMKKSGDILTYSSQLNAKREFLPDILDILEILFHDCMMCSLGKYDGTMLKMSLSEIKELSIGYNVEVVLKLRPVLEQARKRIQLAGNAVSIIDQLLFNILEVKSKCQK